LADIYKLTKTDLLVLELFKEKKADNLLAAIEKSKRRSLARLIFALGIRHVGEKAAYTLAGEFTDIDRLMQAKFEELDKIPEIGFVMARSIADYFKLKQTKKLIDELKKSGLNMRQESAKVKSGKLSGKTIVFTGQLNKFSRSQAESLVRRYGGVPSSSVSRKTDFLVSGEDAGTKFNKAKDLGVKIITEAEFLRLIDL
jgi:DNA ligase (NAD+)